MKSDLPYFLGYVLLFAPALYLCALLGTWAIVILGGAALLATLWTLAEKLGRIEGKLDELLKKRDEHDV